MLVRNSLKMGSPAFCRKPLRQNVRLLFAFCSLNFYIFLRAKAGPSGQPSLADSHLVEGGFCETKPRLSRSLWRPSALPIEN
jgi:hypothetical protein